MSALVDVVLVALAEEVKPGGKVVDVGDDDSVLETAGKLVDVGDVSFLVVDEKVLSTGDVDDVDDATESAESSLLFSLDSFESSRS